MLVRKISMATGKTHEMELDVTPEILARHEAGEHIQNLAPHLTKDEREFIISGTTPEEWEELFGEEDD